MNLNTLRLFVAIIQHGSLSKASERTGVPIATISRQISELEKELNTQLFDRQKSGVKPTMAGQKLYDEVHLSIDNLNNAKQVLFEDERQLKGVLRISATPNFEPVLAWIADFQAEYPHICVHCTMTDRVLDLSADGIDVAFRIGNLHGDSFIAKKVMSVRPKWVAHPDLLARLGTPQSPKDLAKFPLAGWAKNGERLSFKLGKTAFELPYFFASTDTHSLEYMALTGKAVCQLSDFTVDRLVKEKGLVEILPDFDSPAFEVNMIYAAHRYPSAIVRKFVEFVAERVKAA